MTGELINKSNLAAIGGSSWLSQNGTGVTTSASGTFYIYGPVARAYSYATDTNFNAGTNSTMTGVYVTKEGYSYASKVYGGVFN